ncbi:MAG: hypothetical protein WC475_02570 [Candidatus Paceibacterota bacterium]
MRKTRRLHFKSNAEKFCFGALLDACPVTGRDFHIVRKFLAIHIWGRRTPADCSCSECGSFLYKEKREKAKRGMPFCFESRV